MENKAFLKGVNEKEEKAWKEIDDRAKQVVLHLIGWLAEVEEENRQEEKR